MASAPIPSSHAARTRFESIVASPWGEAPAPAFRSLAELLFGAPHPGSVDVLLGTLGDTFAAVSLSHLRHAVARLVETLTERGLAPGDAVALVRLPATSEVVVATAYAACTAAGLEVLLPMVCDEAALGGWLRRVDARAVLWSAGEARGVGGQVAAHLARLEAVVASVGVPAWCLDGDLGVPAILGEVPEPVSQERVDAIVSRSVAEDPCLVLTTSGTTGAQRLVRYTQGALLRSCAGWQAAGLLTPERLGGRNLCPLFAHSMGIRAFWNGVTAGAAVCLVPPEWFEQHPERVRALLRAMRPEQVWGGGGVFRVLLELWRAFPDLATRGLDALRRLVSIGTAWDPALSVELEATFGLPLDNGFGMTEVLQVTTTVHPDAAPGTLGVPLPGVSLGLADAGHGPDAFELHVSSPYAASGVVGEPAFGPWIPTGDVVERGPSGLRVIGRAATDFFKDAFGVKVPRRRFARLYADLGEPIRHLEPFPLRDEPGLAVLAFVGEAPIDARLRDRVEALLLARTLALADQLDETELRHFGVDRLACVPGEPPRTAKGDVASGRVREAHGPLVARLTGRWVVGDDARRLDRTSYEQTDYERYAFPRRGAAMRLLRLDASYEGATGDVLTRGGAPVVDGVGGFGGNLLGHRHPALLDAARRLLDDGASPLLDQGAIRPATGRLAKRLSALVGADTGDAYVVRFGSTGAEAVEMALAHALLEHEDRFVAFQGRLRRAFGARAPEAVTRCLAENRRRFRARRPVVLAVEGGYHGATLATRGLGTSAKRRRGFEAAMGLDVRWLPADGAVDLDALLASLEVPLVTLSAGPDGLVEAETALSGVAAAIAEPILGEGGVFPVDRGLLARLAAAPFPLVVDEVQTGLGRTGTFLASAGLTPDYVTLGKALGGGLAKISALLVERTRYVDRFDDVYSSTFAGDGWSAELALATLDVLTREDVPARARERGVAIGARLERVRRAFPQVVTDVRGAGLMWAIDVDLGPARSFVLRALDTKDLGALVVASWLLHRRGVRLLPTLGRPRTLRFQPSAFVSDSALDQVAAALEAVCDLVARGDVAELVGVVVDPERPVDAPWTTERERRRAPITTAVEEPVPGARRVGFIAHFVRPDEELALADGGLAALGPAARTSLAHRAGALLELEPVVVTRKNILGGAVHLSFLILPAPAFTLRALLRSGDLAEVQDHVQRAVDRAAALGCEVVALGAYTSILTRDGRAILPPPGVRVTTGNSLTVAVGARRVEAACRKAGLDPATPGGRLAVVGATGNIGRALAHRLVVAGPFRHAVLVGRDRARLERLRGELLAAGPAGVEVGVSTDLGALRDAAAVVVATNASEPLVHPWHIAPGRPTIIADVSVPGALDAAVRALPQVRALPLAGAVPVPGEPDLRLSAHTAAGTLFCCAAEGLLLALEPEATAPLSLVGPLEPASVQALEAAAVRHGFLPPHGAAS